MTAKTPIYIAGHSPLVLLGLEFLLKRENYQFRRKFLPSDITISEKGKEGFLLLIHLKKGFTSNLRLIKQFLSEYPLAKIVVLSENCDQRHIKSFFKFGIRAYVLPTISDGKLKQAINEVLSGKSFLDSSVSETWIDMTLNADKKTRKLTRREEEVLDLIIEEHTTREIAEKLFISSCTAETHRINIIRKLGVRNTAGIVREGIRMGR